MDKNGDKASYCIGFEAGERIAGQFEGLNLESAQEGFQDAIYKRTPLLKHEERQGIVTSLLLHLQESQKAAVQKMISQNQRKAESFLRANKVKPDVHTSPTGLQYRVLKSGSGISPALHDKVTVHCLGKRLDGAIFLDTYAKNTPISFSLDSCIAGWSEALKKMKIGDKWQLFIPSYLAFGDKGHSPWHIEPGAALIVDMELLTVARPLHI